MQKTQPVKNELNMDFLNSMNKPIGGTQPQENTVTAPAEEKAESETMDLDADFDNDVIGIDDDSSSRTIKSTQMVIRTTEKEREAFKAYFMKHGLSISKGVKLAIKYLEQQEKKGSVHFSEIGLY